MNAPTASPAFAMLPPLPEPPHDPSSLLLDAHVGWHVQATAGVELAPCGGALTLSLRPEAQRSLTEDSGSFGSLVPPDNVAIAPDCSVFLLDRGALALLRFDSCCCRFERVPCVGGRGGRPRALRNPHGIAICGDTLYVCDSGFDGLTASGPDPHRNALRERIRRENHRVSVFALDGYSLRAHLRPPRARYPHWRPWDVACDSRGCVWVADRAGGALHRFGADGRWLDALSGFVQPVHLAIDGCDRIYVVEAVAGGPARVAVLDAKRHRLVTPARVADAAPCFAPLAFAVLADGRLDLRALCVNPPPGCGWFDADGHPLAPASVPKPLPNPLLATGTFLSGPLDSKTYRCQWHRVIVHGAIPAGTRVRIETFCADEAYDGDQLDGFAVWARQELPAPAQPERDAGRDCLVLSPPGRYVWLRLTLVGNGSATPAIAALELEFPRLTSLRYLPAVFAAEPSSADFTARFLALFDTTMRSMERTVDTEARLFDPSSAPAARVGGAPVDFLTWLASWIGVRFDRSWSEAKRRQFLGRAGALLDWRGTVRGLHEELLILLGWHPPRACRNALPRRVCACRPLNCSPPPAPPCYEPPPLILEHFRLRRWLLLGHARLGAQAMLWGSRIANRSQLGANAKVGHTQLTMTPDPLHDPIRFYANRYTVFVPACYRKSDAARKALENLLRGESPAPVRWNVEYVEPRFRIGVQSMIGFDAVVGELPAGVTLGAAALGTGTLLTGAAAPAIRVGRRGRIGTGARIR
jgi:phage tail-like protein